ncbi:hypothetical protein TTHERM_00655730 (macronuclear) [Tetrahymena thermophila SB210]|uniref:RING-type domain-containing protein n=1 Tax=Tetrahymena thermophila (strain SB210) TaxID=312017 RepID=Q22GX9_TETTS|nr:hypothetical protein TTHERM_00655730 [Tetrahymena thermophila SB210]EAR84545.3 hypothetical protein TTHERM_00655730 [Tetrahymena thermophila SB210]|eukprot:XP_001032208.3 hypothetical protein TTHERM_00655730 [Tetrahymena thermophila SB210]
MSGQPMNNDVFIATLQKCQNLSEESKRYIQTKYSHFREFEWQLGGILIGIIEQSIYAQKVDILNFVEQLRRNQMNNKVVTRSVSQSAQQQFFFYVKDIIDKSDLNMLNQKIKDASFQKICEQILIEQINQNQKLKQYSQLSQQQLTNNSQNYIQPEVIQYLTEILQSKIVLIKYNTSLKQFYYQQFKSVKRDTDITIYSLPKSLIVCIRNKTQVNNMEGIGDGFINVTDMKVRQQSSQQANYNSNTSSINRTIISLQDNKRESSFQPSQQFENMKLCDKCKKALDIILLFKNQQCKQGHYYCFNCLSQKNNQKFCLQNTCNSQMAPELVNQFLQNYSKQLLLYKKQQELKQQQQQQQQQQQLQQQQYQQQQQQQQEVKQKDQVQNQPIIKCVKCNNQVNKDTFYYGNCAHPLCFDCIQKKYLESLKYTYQYALKCDECFQSLDINMIKDFIQSKQESSQKKCLECNKIQPVESLFLTQCRHLFCYDCIYQQYNSYKQGNTSIKCKLCYTIIQIESIVNFLNQNKNRYSESPSKQNKGNNPNKDQLSQSINFQDNQQNSQRILPGQQASPLKSCVKCSKLNTLSSMFITPCNHGYCIQCLCELQSIYKKDFKCIGQYCSNLIPIQSISHFIINQSKNKQENPQNNYQLPISQSIDSNKYNQNISDVPKCLMCRSKFKKNELFYVKSCQHSFCYKCLCTKQFESDQIRCFETGCKSIINVDEIEEFHFQHQMMSSQHLQGKNEQKFEVVCSYCKKQDIISSTQKPDYFKCSSCQKVTCLVHQGQVPQCRCYCEKCGNQCKICENTIMCPKCNYSYCMNCKQTEVGNKICQCVCGYCGTQLKVSKQLCKCIENVCSICLNSFENVQLNSFDDSLLRKNQCIHFYCNICYYKKVTFETQNKQFGNLKFQCLFC